MSSDRFYVLRGRKTATCDDANPERYASEWANNSEF